VTIVVDVAANAGGTTLHNTATVQSAIPDPNPDDNSSSVATTVTAGAAPPVQTSLAITKRVDRTHATTAEPLTFQITVENRGAVPATGVVVTDTFGRPVTLLSVKTTAGTCTPKPLSCRIASLAAGARAVITIVARARTAGRLINGATVTATNALGAVAKPVSVGVVAARTSLSLRKRASRTRVAAGRRVRYRLTLRNRGANPALSVRVCDRLPKGLTLRSAAGARVKGRTACWTIARLAGHASRKFTVNALAAPVSRVTRVRNRATAKGSNTALVARRAGITVVPASAAARDHGLTVSTGSLRRAEARQQAPHRVQPAVGHDHPHGGGVLDAPQRVAAYERQVGQLAGLDRPEILQDADLPGRHER
jgi:uncharacterized repeat protein (TIGR01451 family)